MPTYVLTGVDGQLSSIAATYALTLAQPTDTLIFTSPRPAFIPSSLLTACAARNNDGNGPTIRILMVNYNDPANLVRAFSGADVVAFVSSPNYLAGAARRAQHRNVVEAAQRAGVGRIVYTSLVGAAELGESEMDKVDDTATTATASALMGARDHAYTERLVRESGMVWNIQRNGLFVNSLLSGKQEWNNHAAFVAREDCGRVLGALLMGKGEPNRVYTVYGAAAASENANKNEGAGRGATAMPLSPPASPVSGEEEANHYSKSKSGVTRTTPAPKGHGRRLSAGASRHGDFFGRYGHADATSALEEEEEEEDEEGLVWYGRYISSEMGHLLEGEGADTVRALTGREPVSLFRSEMLNSPISPISPAVVTASEKRDEEKFTRELCCG